MALNPTVTLRIRRLREKAGLSTLELATKAGLSEPDLVQILSNPLSRLKAKPAL